MNAREIKKFIKFIKSPSRYDFCTLLYLKHFPERIVYFVSCDTGPHFRVFNITENRRILLNWFFSNFSTDDEKLELVRNFCDKEKFKFLIPLRDENA